MSWPANVRICKQGRSTTRLHRRSLKPTFPASCRLGDGTSLLIALGVGVSEWVGWRAVGALNVLKHISYADCRHLPCCTRCCCSRLRRLPARCRRVLGVCAATPCCLLVGWSALPRAGGGSALDAVRGAAAASHILSRASHSGASQTCCVQVHASGVHLACLTGANNACVCAVQQGLPTPPSRRISPAAERGRWQCGEHAALPSAAQPCWRSQLAFCKLLDGAPAGTVEVRFSSALFLALACRCVAPRTTTW